MSRPFKKISIKGKLLEKYSSPTNTSVYIFTALNEKHLGQYLFQVLYYKTWISNSPAKFQQ